MHYQLVGFFARIKYLESIAEILRRLDFNIAELYSVRTRNTTHPLPPPMITKHTDPVQNLRRIFELGKHLMIKTSKKNPNLFTQK